MEIVTYGIGLVPHTHILTFFFFRLGRRGASEAELGPLDK
jgi:hypothetical protein